MTNNNLIERLREAASNALNHEILREAADALENQQQPTIFEQVEKLASQRRIVENTYLVSIRQIDEEILALWKSKK